MKVVCDLGHALKAAMQGHNGAPLAQERCGVGTGRAHQRIHPSSGTLLWCFGGHYALELKLYGSVDCFFMCYRLFPRVALGTDQGFH